MVRARTDGLRRVGVISLLTVLSTSVVSEAKGASAWVAACPSCPTSLTVWQEVLGQDFDKNLLVSLAPFLLVGWIARQFELHIGRG